MPLQPVLATFLGSWFMPFLGGALWVLCALPQQLFELLTYRCYVYCALPCSTNSPSLHIPCHPSYLDSLFCPFLPTTFLPTTLWFHDTILPVVCYHLPTCMFSPLQFSFCCFDLFPLYTSLPTCPSPFPLYLLPILSSPSSLGGGGAVLLPHHYYTAWPSHLWYTRLPCSTHLYSPALLTFPYTFPTPLLLCICSVIGSHPCLCGCWLLEQGSGWCGSPSHTTFLTTLALPCLYAPGFVLFPGPLCLPSLPPYLPTPAPTFSSLTFILLPCLLPSCCAAFISHPSCLPAFPFYIFSPCLCPILTSHALLVCPLPVPTPLLPTTFCLLTCLPIYYYTLAPCQLPRLPAAPCIHSCPCVPTTHIASSCCFLPAPASHTPSFPSPPTTHETYPILGSHFMPLLPS